MSKRFNKQNRNKQSIPAQNSGMTERKKKIYAYILAGFIIFWNVASVLGIVAFVRSFAKNDNSSEEHANAAMTYVIDNDDDVQRLSGVITAKAATVQYQQFDLEMQGSTVPPSHLYDNYYCFANGYSFVRFMDTGDLTFHSDKAYSVSRDKITNVNIPVNAFRITGGNPYFDVRTISAKVSYEDGSAPAPKTAFSGDLSCYVRSANLTAYVDKVTLVGGTVGNRIRLKYTFKWYDHSIYLHDTVLWIKYDETAYIYHTNWDFVYPSKAKTYSIVDHATAVIDCGTINNDFSKYFADGNAYGVNQANTYTFENLLTNVIDVPIRAFTDLFNFELLGVNLSSFFFGLLSVCTVIAVIKLFL